jgi:iron(III) transport system ATP-binding protein
MAVSLKIESLSKSFGETRALKDVSIAIEPGELFFLLGPSGCGKTTLLRCIAGFYRPDRGAIRIGERDVARLPPHKRDTGMVFQSYALWPHMSVAENVAFGLRMRKVSRSEREMRVGKALEMVRMSDRAEHKPAQLSGGQQQRVALARALVIEPQCLLLDEPLSNLDAKLRLEMRSEIRRICKQAGLTAVYVTHDQKEALSIADRLAVLDQGTVQQCGTPSEVYRRPLNKFVAGFIGESNFIPARLLGVQDGISTLETPLGRLQSSLPLPAGLTAGAKLTLSIRPEVIGVQHPPADANRFTGSLHDSVYLGEVAQHLLQVAGFEPSLKVFEINPRQIARDRELKTELWVAPADVLMLED